MTWLGLGVAAGLSLYDLGTAMSPERFGLPSPLHAAVKTAVQVSITSSPSFLPLSYHTPLPLHHISSHFNRTDFTFSPYLMSELISVAANSL